MGSRILIVDDEESILFSLRRALERDGHEVWTSGDGHQALRLVQHHVFDLILTDLKMEGVGGVEVLRQARAMSPDTAIIMLTGYATLESAIEALRLGAIDYLTKPCSTTDVRASVEKGLARRYRELRRRQLLQQMSATLAELRDETFPPTPTQPPVPSPLPPGTGLQIILRHGNVIIDRQRHQVTVEEQKVDLTPTEFKLLAHLTENADKVVSCSELVLAAHGYQTSEAEARKVIRPHITNLRQKLSASLGTQPYILNVRGVGYVLAPAIEESTGNQ
jgi:DNA-binding response OmpR family regulator